MTPRLGGGPPALSSSSHVIALLSCESSIGEGARIVTDIAVETQPDATFPSGGNLVIERRDGRYRALAARPFAAGEVVVRLEGRVRAHADRYSIQIGVDGHLVVPPGADPREIVARYPWRFLDHACDPSAAFRGWELVARRDLAPLDEVTFDYETTEWELAVPFRCACGEAACRGEIRGFRFLAPDTARRLPEVAAHLLVRTS